MDIRISGATQNTLRHVNLSLPTGKIIALAGPSGSGKSTLAYDTLFAESRRRFLECLSPSARRMMARPPKPSVESIDGLPPALCLQQGLPSSTSRSVLGSITETLDYLRILYAAAGTPHDPVTGEELTRLSSDEIAKKLTSLPEGTRLTLLSPLKDHVGDGEGDLSTLQLRKSGYLRLRVNGTMHELDELEEHPPASDDELELVVDRLIVKPQNSARLADSLQSALRLWPDEVRVLVQEDAAAPAHLQSFHTRYRSEQTGFTLPDLSPEFFSPYSARGACQTCGGRGAVQKKGKSWDTCPACGGMRLNPIALAVTLRFADRDIGLADFCRLTVRENLSLLPQMALPAVCREALQAALDALHTRLSCLQELGLDYLTLDRRASTLSGGELQRARLAGQIGGGLSGVLYILDEPTIGLHPTETQRLITALRRLRDKGNTVLVVEHDPDMLRAADWLVEMGPGSGPNGGRIMTVGTCEELMSNPESPTGAWLAGRCRYSRPTPIEPGAHGWLTLRGAKARNLKNIDFTFPASAFTCLAGPGGSGKSTLVHECLLPALKNGRLEGAAHIERAVIVDQSPISASLHSTPATATGLLDILRSLYARLPLSRARGYTPARFSLNMRGGRCEKCGGVGRLQVDMNFLADLYAPCDACHGARYNRETLECTWRGKSIAQALALTVDEALAFFANIPTAVAILQAMKDVGLGYISLDRPADSLSGGEAQRVKIATYLAKASPAKTRRTPHDKKLLFILDEPASGLHFVEVDMLLQAIYRLRDAGHTILCIEHHSGMLSRADYLVQLGPGSGDDGGRITFAGAPERFENLE